VDSPGRNRRVVARCPGPFEKLLALWVTRSCIAIVADDDKHGSRLGRSAGEDRFKDGANSGDNTRIFGENALVAGDEEPEVAEDV